MAQRYEPFFDPLNPRVQEMAGSGAYSGWNGSIDVGPLKQMTFSVLREAALDWSHTGMYFPHLTRILDAVGGPLNDLDEHTGTMSAGRSR
jgi:hypothetical protein